VWSPLARADPNVEGLDGRKGVRDWVGWGVAHFVKATPGGWRPTRAVPAPCQSAGRKALGRVGGSEHEGQAVTYDRPRMPTTLIPWYQLRELSNVPDGPGLYAWYAVPVVGPPDLATAEPMARLLAQHTLSLRHPDLAAEIPGLPAQL
jgi:hypothetical protein